MPHDHHFLRVAACAPELRVADPRFNADRTLDLLRQAEDVGADLVVFPEMGLTGYTCNDLFHHHALLRDTLEALDRIVAATREFGGVVLVGLPLEVDGRLYNAAAVLRGGAVLGIVPKTHLPTYKEFYDARFFAHAATATRDSIELFGRSVPFGTDVLFAADDDSGFVLGVEICEDLWMPVPPSSLLALGGATVLANLSASNETIGKAPYRRQLVVGQSGRRIAGYVYAGAGVGESTTDLVFGGHCLIAENGSLLKESERFQRGSAFLAQDIDLDRLQHDRIQTGTFGESLRSAKLDVAFRRIHFPALKRESRSPALIRYVDPHPFVPSDPATLKDRCDEIFHTQVAGLAKRLEHIGAKAASIGVSGGLDSTLALVVLCKTLDRLGLPRSAVRALTMPGFGTTGRTKGNAIALSKELGLTLREIDIRQLCLDEMRALGHAPFGLPLDGETVETLTEKLKRVPPDRRNDLVFENVQARVRTSLLMNTAFVIGTGDLSELALGWCTYNADHMSMYNVNVGVPKTLVRFLVRWAAEHEFDGAARRTLLDIAASPISPELLPTHDEKEPQSTEGTIGPYELHDFFLYHFLRFGFPPEKILFLATQATFDRPYPPDEIRRWLRVFLTRFFASQFKRSCLPDGPKVGSVTLSPRGDWRMPSDAVARAWLESLGDG